MPTLTDSEILKIARDKRLVDARAAVERLRPLAYSRVDGGAYIGPLLKATRDLVRAEHAVRTAEG